MAQNAQRNRPLRSSTQTRTSADRWLLKQSEDRRLVTILFQTNPVSSDVGIEFDCTVIDVDRYFLLLEFPSGQTWWVAKSNVLSFGTTK